MIQTSYGNHLRYFATRSKTRRLTQYFLPCISPGDLLPAAVAANNWTSIYLGSSFMGGNVFFTMIQAGPGLKMGLWLNVYFSNLPGWVLDLREVLRHGL